MNEEEIRRSAAALIAAIEAMESDLNQSVKSLQAQLADLLIYEISSKLKVEKSLIKPLGNASTVSIIDQVWGRVYDSLIAPVLRGMVKSYRKVIELVRGYFTEAGLLSGQTAERSVSEALLSARIGINSEGRLLNSGYLYRLGKSDAVREQLKNYVTNSINNGVSLFDFQRGFRALLTGTPDVDGALIRYYRQYAFDTFNQVAEWSNRKYAEAAGLEFFIYEGSLIATSRKFCEKRAGKVFHVSETEGWVNDPDLIDKKTAATYDPIIERGRYNCRHIIRWISKELALRLRPDAIRFT